MNTLTRLPPLNSLKVFEATARHLSMVNAGIELHITHGAVSRQIKQLESQLGVTLFIRRNRAIFLTHEGETLRQTCVQIMAQLSHTIAQITPHNAAQPLVVSCEPTLAMRWLIARLPSFQAQHPEIAVHLFTAGGAVRFAEQGIDLAIRRNDFDMTNLHVETLAAEQMGPVCTPELWDKHNGLQHMPRLHSRTRPHAWDAWLTQTATSLAPDSEHWFEHFYLSLHAASAGLGVAMASRHMIEQELSEGRLLAPLGFIEDGSHYCLISSKPFDADARALCFLEWLQRAFVAD